MKTPIIFLFLYLLTFNSHTATPPTAGTLIDKSNVGGYANFLDLPIIKLIEEGRLSVTVGESFNLPQNAKYVEYTQQYKGTAQINPDSGQIENYQEGLPFTNEPSTADPMAGLKIAWNMRYAYGGDTSIVDPFIWDYINMNNGKIERSISFVGKILRYKHRTTVEPTPNLPRNPVDIFNGIYLLAKEPFDLKNTQLLVHRLEDDSARERTWLYLSVQRRVRRLPAGQTTDAFLGSDIMIEDFLGYNGRIKDMTWTYLGTKNLLTPFYKHTDAYPQTDGYQFGEFHGQGACFPNVPWQVRKTYVIEAKPVSDSHPLSKRIYYIDAQTFVPIAGRYYDRNKAIWRLAIGAFSHPDFHLPENTHSGVAIPTLISMIDVQANHCTTLKMKTIVNSTKVKQKDFTVQALRSKGK
ncbi:MAG: outer membrane lipoprotein-sorting protein [Piscirickettsiaceae bacterium]|nr:MAG: outer membrane lipoprotein-sorting protein [Piscirickettsiaceae bacterium]PCI70956.1 MAG: outer membrane lipoprotein-sorting protein [Piscirickettsiaceae bacterium]